MRFLRNAWYVGAWAEQLDGGGLVDRLVIGHPVVLFRGPDGSPVALTDVCPHRFAPLHRGHLRDRAIECAYHGLRFDHTGACVHNPHGSGRIPPRCRTTSYPLVERHTIVWIWMGDRDPDESLIPDYSFLDPTSGLVTSPRGMIVIEANYQLIVDNLLDLSHVSFLHRGILGDPENAAADTEVDQHGNTIYASRLLQDIDPPGLFDMMYRRDGQPVDHWTTMRWDPPSNLRNDAGIHPVGGTRTDGVGIYGAHLLVPETERRTRYYFCAAQQDLCPDLEDPPDEVAARLGELRRFAFEDQDKPMIEAQQRNIDLEPELTATPVALRIDQGALRAQRLLADLIDLEHTSGAAS
ncbi:MAG: aromatic ring-hydroxylating dioxygenase subunit alpha [Acidimicrobiia bacterium]|nr:aromatic ring-hydroxylating dioxygenase subunit alpha [Acidimicrobiia bacterium]